MRFTLCTLAGMPLASVSLTLVVSPSGISGPHAIGPGRREGMAATITALSYLS